MNSGAILLAGAGGHARVCIDVIETEGRFAIGGVVGLPQEVGTEILGYPIVGTDSDLPALRERYSVALVSVGQIKSPDQRIRLYSTLEELGYALPIVISPRAYVSRHATVGLGTLIVHGAVVNAGARIGRNCIVNSQALVEHDCLIEDHCHISTAAALNSGIRVGEGSFLGSQSSVRQGTTIGRRCVVGMGQRVLADCPDGTWMPTRREHR